jgi:hypothetical protein
MARLASRIEAGALLGHLDQSEWHMAVRGQPVDTNSPLRNPGVHPPLPPFCVSVHSKGS